MTNSSAPDAPANAGIDASAIDAGSIDASSAADAGSADAMVDAAPADFTITAAMPQLDLRVPKVTSLGVAIQRGAGFSDAVVVSATGLPAGVSANPITIAAGQTQGTLMLDASGGKGGDQATVTLVGTSGTLMHTADVSVFVVGAAGTPDATFGSSGHAALPASISDATINSLLPGPNGTFIAVGTDAGSIIAARFLGDGSLDTSFGQSGVAHVSFASLDIQTIAYAVGALQSSGNIVLAGSGKDSANSYDLALARLTPDGATDGAFAGGGKAKYFTTVQCGLNGIALDAMDRILITDGFGAAGGPTLARFTVNGGLDSSFHSSGYLTTNTTNEPPAVDANGSILVYSSANSELVRYLDNGNLDPNFGQNGVDNLSQFLKGPILPLASGAILVATQGDIYGLHNNGSIDTNFGTNGTLAVNANPGALVLTPAGLAIEAGEDSSNHLVLARVGDLAGGTLDSSFGTNGVVVDSNVTGFPASLALRTGSRLVVVINSSGTSSFAEYWY